MDCFSENEKFNQFNFEQKFYGDDKCNDAALTTLLPNGQLEERVKVDRKKFEQMINGENVETGDAEEFFKHIMQKTNSTISWPPRLKIGTKSKKDPHIRIAGTADEIAAAKEIIMNFLDSRRNRVTLKMDVAFTDHSHIIGKGGRCIQKVMDDTGCHIHFPDSNRTSAIEKSNQVSIAGTSAGVERARCGIRELLPITIVIDLPATAVTTNALDVTAPAIQSIQQTYGVTITIRFSARPSFADYSVLATGANFLIVSVRGTRSHVLSLRQGVLVLIEYLVGSTMQSIPLTVSIEIAAQHHSFVIGRGECNLKAIMQQTGVVITFPDNTASDMKVVGAFKKSTVIIKGHSFDSVFLAWQEILGYLPLVLIFDLKEGQELDSAQITQIMEQLKVSILIKPKQKQNLKSIMVRGQERDSRLLFEVRRQILDLDESEVPVCCDQHAWLLASKLISMFLPYCGVPGMPQVKPFTQTTVPPSGLPTLSKNFLQSPNPFHLKAMNHIMPLQKAPQLNYGNEPSQKVPQLNYGSEPSQKVPQLNYGNELLKFDKSMSNSCPSTTPSLNSSFSSNSTPASKATPQSLNTMEARTPFSQIWPERTPTEYNALKVKSLKAIRAKPSASETRTPNSVWSGLGFSKTTPSTAFKEKLTSDWKSTAECSATPFKESMDLPMHSNFWESEKFNAKTNTEFVRKSNFSQTHYFDMASDLRQLPHKHVLNSPTSFENQDKLAMLDLSTVLAELGASKYVDAFQHHHIDFKTFLTLNDADLQELGVAYFGRQKLLNIITDLKRSLGIESLSARFNAAPGAERRRKSNFLSK